MGSAICEAHDANSQLTGRSTGATIYIRDEPSPGLRFKDVAKLLGVLHRLVDQGNTAVVIEHNLSVIKTADWLINVGPEGDLVEVFYGAKGTPDELDSRAGIEERHLKVVLGALIWLRISRVSLLQIKERTHGC